MNKNMTKFEKQIKENNKMFRENNPVLIDKLNKKIKKLISKYKDIKLDINLDHIMTLHSLHGQSFEEIFNDLENIAIKTRNRFINNKEKQKLKNV